MASAQLVFTVMPRGLTADRDLLPVSVYVSPRLVGADRLGAFPDWLRWTERLVTSGLALKFSAAGGDLTLPVDTSALRPDLWAAAFSADTYVRSHTFDDFSHHGVFSWNVRYALSTLKSLYQRAGIDLALPDTRTEEQQQRGDSRRRLVKQLLAGLEANWNGDRGDSWRERYRQRYDEEARFPRSYEPGALGADGLLTLELPPTEGDDRHRELVESFAVMNHVPPGLPLADHPPDMEHLIDFHQAVSSLNSYPELMRDLGLVFDLELPLALLDHPGATTATLSITGVEPGAPWELPDTSVPPALPSPATRYFLSWNPAHDSFRFGTAPAGYDEGDDQWDSLGLLNLRPEGYGLAQVDVDGGMHKLIMLSESWQDDRLQPAASIHPEVFDETTTLPALRSGGLTLFADGRAVQLLRRLQRSKKLDDALAGVPTDALVAGDLVHGYRLDVWDSHSGRWHSLHRRHAEFVIGGLSRTVTDREGFTQLAATQAGVDPAHPQPDDLYLHEAIARWTGWSLSVPPAGRHLSSDPDPERALDNPDENAPVTPFKLTTRFAVVRGSLPSLRFGRRYRFRARVTDLCGGSLELDDPLTDALSSGGFSLPVDPDGFAYLRYEPVGAPILVARDVRAVTGPGSSIDRLVIRTYNSAPALDGATADLAAGDRHLAPPRTTVDLAEKLSMFDDASGTLVGSAAMYALIAARDAGQLHEDSSEVAGQQQRYPLEPAETIPELPYLPDVLSAGVALRDLPGTDDGTLGRLTAPDDPAATLAYARLSDPNPRGGSATLVDFGGRADWQQIRPLRLALAEAAEPTAPGWDAAKRVLTVFLPKATTSLVPLSSFASPAGLKLMGIWQWIREHIEDRAQRTPDEDVLPVPHGTVSDVDQVAHVVQRAVEGGHWMLTPPTILTLVHATQQPLGSPAFSALPVQHEPYGDPTLPPWDETRRASPTVLQTEPEKAPTSETELDPVTAWRRPASLDAYLLGGLHIHAASTDKVDLAATWTDPVDDPAQGGPTTAQHSAAVDTVPVRDTTEGVIGVELGTDNARAVAYYDADHDLLCFVRAGDALGNLRSSDPRAPHTMPYDAAPRHHLGDTRHHRIGYTATATSAFRDYFPADVDGGFTRSSAPVLVDVPASERPRAPQVAYVVPTFGWQRQSDTNVRRSVRFGGGLRIFLERGWWSSGEGELLGISLYSYANEGELDLDRWRPHVTEWGADPIWQADGLSLPVPGVANFPDADASEQLVSLEARGDLLADVVGYRVTFDDERQLWYADVTVTADSYAYAPFIRLALVRYQPHAIPEAKISRVVLADFAQLTPGRSAVVTADPYHPRRLRVTVTGVAPTGPVPIVTPGGVDQQPRPTAVTVVVQERRDDIGGDLAWRDAAPEVVSVTDRTAEAPPASPALVLWTGTVDFAAEVPADRYRLLICEHEYFSANHVLTEYDETTGDPHAVAPRRLVYAETLELDDALVGGPPSYSGTTLPS